MAETAAFLVDEVLPHVRVRQWVLSLPIALRYKLAYDSELASAVLQQIGGQGSFERRRGDVEAAGTKPAQRRKVLDKTTVVDVKDVIRRSVVGPS